MYSTVQAPFRIGQPVPSSSLLGAGGCSPGSEHITPGFVSADPHRMYPFSPVNLLSHQLPYWHRGGGFLFFVPQLTPQLRPLDIADNYVYITVIT